jgi:hypothetical protein
VVYNFFRFDFRIFFEFNQGLILLMGLINDWFFGLFVGIGGALV